MQMNLFLSGVLSEYCALLIELTKTNSNAFITIFNKLPQ